MGDLDKLAALLRRERDGPLSRWRPQLIDELAAALPGEASPPAHGFEEVVAEYSTLRGCIHDLAQADGLTLQGEPSHMLNRVLDRATGLALKTFAGERSLEAQQRREEYLACVAHDLRAPLTEILLAVSLLDLALPAGIAGAAHAKVFETVRRNARHLDSLVGKVIEENAGLLSEPGVKLRRQAFELWPLVEALVGDLDPVAHAARTRVINQVPDGLIVYADAGLLRRVFQNVIANAIAYTPRGEVVIGARQFGAAGSFECWVSDNGAGIPQTFVDAHDGRISVESREGLGSTLRFTLPRALVP